MGDKELSTGMERSIPLLLMVNVGKRLPGSPLMDKGSARLSYMSPKAKGLLSFHMGKKFTHRGAYNLDLSMKSI